MTPQQRGFWRREDALAPLKDDRAWEAARKRRRKRDPDAPPDDGGPRCGRCAHWQPPEGDERYGECRELMATTRRGGAKEIVATEAAIRLMASGTLHEMDALRCAEWFICSRHAGREAG